MDSDMVVALPPSTADGRTLLGHRYRTGSTLDVRLSQMPGRAYAFGEMLRFGDVLVPQVRQTFAVLGAGRDGWGLLHGVNACGLAVACLPFRSRLSLPNPVLTGPDLVRLALERCHAAHQAVELLGDLNLRHGQGMPEETDDSGHDTAFLLADSAEAFLLAASGGHWAEQEVRQVRAVGGVCHVRQDWDRVSRGLADLVISRGWWPEDGSKIDFEGTVGDPPSATALRRWGRTTMMLEEQNGHIDHAFLRRLLADRLGEEDVSGTDQASLLAQLPRCPEERLIAWCGMGAAEAALTFPLLPEGEVPAPFRGSVHEEGSVRHSLDRLAIYARSGTSAATAVAELLGVFQARLDHEAREHQETTAALCQGNGEERRRQASLFMQHQCERFDDLVCELGLSERLSGAALAALPG
jgi:hypothetical protein